MIQATTDAFKRLIQGRAFAYNRVFDAKNQHVYEVLNDLARFCRAHETTFHPDPRVHAALEGRREVWLRIQEYLQLDIEEIYKLHRVKEIPAGEKR